MNMMNDSPGQWEERSDPQVCSSKNRTSKLLSQARRKLRDGSMRMLILILVMVIVGIFMLPE